MEVEASARGWDGQEGTQGGFEELLRSVQEARKVGALEVNAPALDFAGCGKDSAEELLIQAAGHVARAEE